MKCPFCDKETIKRQVYKIVQVNPFLSSSTLLLEFTKKRATKWLCICKRRRFSSFVHAMSYLVWWCVLRFIRTRNVTCVISKLADCVVILKNSLNEYCWHQNLSVMNSRVLCKHHLSPNTIQLMRKLLWFEEPWLPCYAHCRYLIKKKSLSMFLSKKYCLHSDIKMSYHCLPWPSAW